MDRLHEVEVPSLAAPEASPRRAPAAHVASGGDSGHFEIGRMPMLWTHLSSQ